MATLSVATSHDGMSSEPSSRKSPAWSTSTITSRTSAVVAQVSAVSCSTARPVGEPQPRRGDVLPARAPVVPSPANYQPADVQKSGSGAPMAGRELRLPDERNGLIFVFRVFEKLSYAIVLKATKPIYIGDVVQTP